MPIAAVVSTAAETYEGWKAVAAVCGPLISGGIALLAIIMTNKGHEKRLLLQMQAEDARKSLEREMAMRKEIFLEAAESIDEKLSFIGRIGNLNLDNKIVADELSMTLKGSAKIYLVGSEEMIKSYMTFMHNYSANILALISKRNVAAESFSLLEEFRKNKKTINAHSAYDIANRERDLEVQFTERYVELLECVGDIAEKQIALTKDVLIAARKDLNIEISDPVLDEIIQTMITKGREMLSSVRQQLKAQLTRAKSISFPPNNNVKG